MRQWFTDSMSDVVVCRV